jgi:hypothetical protein
MAGRGGARSGAGRKAGGRNRATIERASLAERIVAEQQGKPGRKLGKEMLEEFAILFAGLAAHFQPVSLARVAPGEAPPPLTQQDMELWAKSYREPLFEKYAKLAAKCASDVADFQSPRMGTLQVPAPSPPHTGQIRKRFTINIFDHQGRPVPRQIEPRDNKKLS